MNSPLITIITPSLNQDKYIRKTIDSVLGQNYPALEYLVVDGVSTDETLGILQSYRNHLAWLSEPDHGQSQAINKGWQRTRGEVISWLNSDDLLYPGALNKVAAFFDDNPEIDILYGNCDYIDANGEVLKPYPTHPFDYLQLLVSTHNYLPQPATFIRRRVLQAIGGLDENLHYVMDFEYWLRAGLHCRIAHLPTTLAGLRIHEAAKSIADLDKMAHELVKIYELYFRSPGLPGMIGSHEPEAMSMIYYRAADCLFWVGKLVEARQYGWQSWKLRPAKMRHLWMLLALGKVGLSFARKYMTNPYLVNH